MRGELKHHFAIKRVYILGAGFSYSAGLPLTNELLQLIHKQAAKMSYGNEPWGQAEKLKNYLSYYYPTLEFTHEGIRNGIFNETINIEEFLSFTSAESSFLDQGQNLTEHGSTFVSFSKKWIGEIIVKKQGGISDRIPDYYHDFIKQLDNSLILTFNWDTIIETLLDSYGISYRYELNSQDYDSRRTSIPLIKMHGSIDWISNSKRLENDENLSFESLGAGFGNIVKAKGNILNFYEGLYYPWIVLPNFDKITQLRNYGETWVEPTRYLDDDLEVIIIGYSLRPDDFHSRCFIYPKLVEGSRKGNVKVKVVDFAENDEKKQEIEARYTGVENCKFWFSGFNEEAIKFINE